MRRPLVMVSVIWMGYLSTEMVLIYLPTAIKAALEARK